MTFIFWLLTVGFEIGFLFVNSLILIEPQRQGALDPLWLGAFVIIFWPGTGPGCFTEPDTVSTSHDFPKKEC
jgi:hypothetical protein